MPPKMPPWSDIQQKKYLWLYNYLITLDTKYKTLKPDDYLIKFNKRNLIQLINNNNNWSDSSKESLFFTVARWLELNKPTDNFIKQFKELGYKLKVKRDKQEGENQPDKKELENIQPFEYFINILNDIKPDEIITRQKHYEYLILALLTLQPPIRTSFYISAKITNTLKNLSSSENYIYIKNDQAFYIVNKDKVSNTKKYNSKAELNYIDITDKRLIQILNNSILKFNREYLFESNQKGTIKQETLLKYLRNITNLKAINIDMMRAIYITNFYKDNKTYKAREELSLKMRHSVPTAMKNYLKINNTLNDENEELKQVKDENIKLTIRIKELEKELNQLKAQAATDEKIINKKRQDIIYKANIKNVKPKEDTLNKYNIKYNETNKLYY